MRKYTRTASGGQKIVFRKTIKKPVLTHSIHKNGPQLIKKTITKTNITRLAKSVKIRTRINTTTTTKLLRAASIRLPLSQHGVNFEPSVTQKVTTTTTTTTVSMSNRLAKLKSLNRAPTSISSTTTPTTTLTTTPSTTPTPSNPAWTLPVYVVTINPSRFNDFKNRSRLISSHVHKWEGTNGRSINRAEWARKRGARGNLRRGELGCYDSHVRLWRHMVANNIPQMLICEDDCNLTGSKAQMDQIHKCLDELKHAKVKYNCLFISHHRPRQELASKVTHTSNLKWQWTFCQCCCYLIDLTTARLLTNRPEARLIREPVDVMLHTLHKVGVLKNVVRVPPVMQVIPYRSETKAIK